MFWKCVLVGLALVLPGTLLIVEGHSDQNGDGSDGASLLSSLLESKLHRQPYDSPQEKKSDTDNDLVQDVESNENAIVQDASNTNKQPPESPGHSNRQNGQISAQVGGPKASPLSNAKADWGGGGAVPSQTTRFIIIVTGCTVLAAIGIVGAGVCWYKYHKRAKAASLVEYPAYGVTGPTKDHLPSPGDRKLAKSAQMYHYQHQKQQMIAMEKANGNMKHDASDDESEEDNVEGDYTVYECPGLAPTGEMEVKNPLFRGDETPSAPAPEESQQPQGDN